MRRLPLSRLEQARRVDRPALRRKEPENDQHQQRAGSGRAERKRDPGARRPAKPLGTPPGSELRRKRGSLLDRQLRDFLYAAHSLGAALAGPRVFGGVAQLVRARES